MKRVYMMPTIDHAKKDTSNSINQIVLRIAQHLTMYGWQIVDNPADADIIAAHAGAAHDDIPCDVAHCHGLYPTAEFNQHKWHYSANANVLSNLNQARAITVPSDWVREIVQRECNRDANVIRWAIDRADWQRGAHKGFTLWNKTRVDDVCDPRPIDYLATTIDDAPFVTTFTNLDSPPDNLRITGRLPFDEMKTVIHNAALYIATTKETFGIGTLEAMACGTPVLGYNWGGTADIVRHGVDGYLVEPGDLEGLVDGWRWCFRHRRQLARNARARARDDFYTWDRVARQFAEVYDSVYENKQRPPDAPDVSIIIPCHNYAHYVGLTLDSVIAQKTDYSIEVILVDDGSDDDLQRVIDLKAPLMPFNFRVMHNQRPKGVANARNMGIRASCGRYVICLDADDAIGPEFVQVHAAALDNDPSLDLVYSGLATMRGDNTDEYHVSHFPPPFDARSQATGANQVPTCNMFRRRAWDRAGGYRSYLQPAEDAGLWLDMLMTGAHIKKISNDAHFFYRLHDKSLSAPVRMNQLREPRWAQRYPLQRPPAVSRLNAKYASHDVGNYDNPLVSFIIPVGSGHQNDVIHALDSIQAQTDTRWEAIVVNDTGGILTLPHAWARVIAHTNPVGTGEARNRGLSIARGQYVVFLDADDWIRPRFIEETLQTHQRTGRYVYTDWVEHRNGHSEKIHTADEYSQAKIFTEKSIHAVTALIPRVWAQDVGGFDTEMPAWEDTDFFMKMAAAGYCGIRLSQPLFVYNYDAGKRRDRGVNDAPALRETLTNRYAEFMDNPEMACGCSKLKVQTTATAHDNDDDMIRVQMVGGHTAASTVRGAMTGVSYQRRKRGDIFLMYEADARAQPDVFQPVQTVERNIEPTPEPPAPPDLAGGES